MSKARQTRRYQVSSFPCPPSMCLPIAPIQFLLPLFLLLWLQKDHFASDASQCNQLFESNWALATASASTIHAASGVAAPVNGAVLSANWRCLRPSQILRTHQIAPSGTATQE